jgi:hypothetical protein
MIANRSPSISFRYRMLQFESVCQPRLSTVSCGRASSSQPFELALDGWSVLSVSKGSFTATQKSRLEPRHWRLEKTQLIRILSTVSGTAAS